MIAFCPVCGRKLKPHYQPCGQAYGLDVTMYYCQTGGHSFEVIDDPESGYQRIESPDTPHCRPASRPKDSK